MGVVSGIKKLLSGVVLGILAYASGFLIFALLLYERVKNAYQSLGLPIDFSALRNQLGDSVLPNAARIVGWMWESAHMVVFNFSANAAFIGEVNETINFTQTPIWNNTYFIIPPLVLIVFGFLHNRIHSDTSSYAGLKTGITLSIGYAAVFGVVMYLTMWHIFLGLATVQLTPEWGQGFIASLVYPMVFATLGGYIGSTTG